MEEDGVDWTQLPIFKNIPVIYRDLKWIYEGFLILSRSRQVGFSSPQAISISEVLSYVQYEGIEDSEDKEDFLYFVQFLDNIYLEEMSKRNANSKSKGAK